MRGPTCSGPRCSPYAWPDVLGASVLAGRAPQVIRATRLVPVGRQRGLRRRLPVVPGLVLRADEDPVLGLVRRRRQAKEAGDTVLASALHAVVNSLVSGHPSRTDEYLRNVARGHHQARWERVEKPGPWTFFPIATSVQAGAHLLLAVLDRMVRDRGGVVVLRDTDSSFIAASPEGGSRRLADGSTLALLAWAEVDEVLGAFGRLAPEPDWPVWKVDSERDGLALHAVSFGMKRHLEFLDGDHPQLLARTEANLGGWYADSPTMAGRDPEHGGRRWTWAMAEREVAYALAQQRAPKEAVRSPVPWDEPGAEATPGIRRLAARTPTIFASLPTALGARPGSRYLEALVADPGHERRRPVALDPGGSLAGWRRLRWIDRRTGEPVEVTTSFEVGAATGAVVLATLRAEAAAWSRPRPPDPIASVTITAHNVRPVGRVSGVLDAHLTGEPGDLAARRPSYGGPDRVGAVHEVARSMGPRPFARMSGLHRHVAERVVKGLPLSDTTIARADAALRANGAEPPMCGCGCDLPVPAGRRGYVDDRHRERAKRRRARARSASE